ncbi:MAG: DNA polymerase III subunit delta [Paraprevotella sp.]|nr:DNA polymerase III subunit delta [Paraprevotella sp.]
MAVKKEGITYEEIVRSVRAGKYAPIYYLMGEEDYYIDRLSEFITNSALKEDEKDFNLTVCYGADVTVDDVINAAKRFPMMAERQVVLVREAQQLEERDKLSFYLAHPQPSTVLILCHKHGVLDRRKKLAADIQKVGVLFESKRLYDNQLPSFVTSYLQRKDGIKMDSNAVLMICEHVGSDLSRLTGELDKLILALREGEKQINADFVERHVGISKDFNNFELLAALIDKDVLKVNRIVKYFNDNPKGYSLQLTLSTLFGFFSNLMVAYYSPVKTEEGIAEWIEQPVWQVRKNILPGLKKFSDVKTMQIIEKIRETDAKSKGIGNTIADSGALLTELTHFILH